MQNSNKQTDLTHDLAALARMPIQQLRERWRTIFRAEPPPAFGPDLLRRSIAHKLQEKHYGGLSAAAQRQLDQIVKAMASNPGGRLTLPRRIMPGAVLVRSWKDKSHRVTILADGFSFDGRTYQSLSQIAREITGARWNGPRFFGLRAKASEISAPLPAAAALARRGKGQDLQNNDLFGCMEAAHGR
jgi:DUF2924 family protein